MDARKDDRDDLQALSNHTLNIDWSSETERSIGPYRLVKLLGQLAPGLSAPHHEHRAGRQSSRIGEFLREELNDVLGK